MIKKRSPLTHNCTNMWPPTCKSNPKREVNTREHFGDNPARYRYRDYSRNGSMFNAVFVLWEAWLFSPFVIISPWNRYREFVKQRMQQWARHQNQACMLHVHYKWHGTNKSLLKSSRTISRIPKSWTRNGVSVIRYFTIFEIRGFCADISDIL